MSKMSDDMKNQLISELARKIVEAGINGKATDIVLSVNQRPYIKEHNNQISFLSNDVLSYNDLKSLENYVNRFLVECDKKVPLDIIYEKSNPSTVGTWERRDKENAISHVFQHISQIDGIGVESAKKLLSSLGDDTFDSFHISYRSSTGALIPLHGKDFQNFLTNMSSCFSKTFVEESGFEIE